MDKNIIENVLDLIIISTDLLTGSKPLTGEHLDKLDEAKRASSTTVSTIKGMK